MNAAGNGRPPQTGAGSDLTSRTRSTAAWLEASGWNNDTNPTWSLEPLVFEGPPRSTVAANGAVNKLPVVPIAAYGSRR